MDCWKRRSGLVTVTAQPVTASSSLNDESHPTRHPHRSRRMDEKDTSHASVRVPSRDVRRSPKMLSNRWVAGLHCQRLSIAVAPRRNGYVDAAKERKSEDVSCTSIQ